MSVTKEKEKSYDNGDFLICKGSDVAAYYLDISGSEGYIDPSKAGSRSIWSPNKQIPT
jgi:hypothetical protein